MRAPSSAADDRTGVVWPAGPDGLRSTRRAGQTIVGAALAPLDASAAAAAREEREWRANYPAHFRQLVQRGLVDADAAIASARAGLRAAWATLQWRDGDGERAIESLYHSWIVEPAGRDHEELATFTVRGSGATRPAPWVVPYRGEQLAGDRLQRQIDDWQSRDVIEPSAAAALQRCVAHHDWFDLSDRTLVLLGAGSEAGPLPWLARWRASIVAVDVPRPDLWTRIEGLVHVGNGTLHVPVRASRVPPGAADRVAAAGADLLADAPAVARWIRTFDGPLDVAALAYLDGERHVRVALAMDLVQRAACSDRRDTTLAFLATPTDVFAVPREAALAAMARHRRRGAVARAAQAALHRLGGSRYFVPNVTALLTNAAGAEHGVVDGLILEQGPNYALAKRIQQWRALVARADGHRVSSNVAPSTATASVVRNRALAVGFAGASRFGIEAFEPATTSALMAALWVHDLRSDASAAGPQRPLGHPFELFMDNACHGGLWRGAYLPRSALVFAAALGWLHPGRAT